MEGSNLTSPIRGQTNITYHLWGILNKNIYSESTHEDQPDKSKSREML